MPRRAIVLPLREMGPGEGLNSGRPAPAPPGPGEATGFGAPAVQIELTPSQILHVCEVASGPVSGVGALRGLAADARRLCDLLNEVARNPRPKFSKSFVCGLYVLASLPDDGKPVGIVKLAALLKMPSATLHRYLHTLVVAGLVQRDENTREYSLAPGLVAAPALAVEGE